MDDARIGPQTFRGMRQLAQFEEEAVARRFCDFVLAEGIEAEVDTNAEGRFSLWVLDEAHLDDARALLEVFERDPESARVHEGLAEMRRRRSERALTEGERLRRAAAMHQAQALAMQVRKAGPVTYFMIFATLGFSGMALFFSGGEPERVFAVLSATPEALLAGELWRLVTPMFVRSGLPDPLAVISVLFGVFWLRTLGGPVERLHGSVTLGFVMLLSAALATAAELALFGESVGGTMGASATLFSYLWLRGRVDPSMPIRLRSDIALWLFLWFVLSLSGPAGDRLAPRWLVGLSLGAAWALAVSAWGRRPRA